MPNINHSGRMLLVAALAASTTLTGPTFAFAQQGQPIIRLAQADDPGDADAGASEDAPAKPRRKRPAASEDAGETTSEEAPQARRQKRQAAESESGEDAAPKRRNAQPAADDAADDAAPAAKPQRQTKKQREAQPDTEATQPDAGARDAASEQPASRRDRRKAASQEEAAPTSSDDETPRAGTRKRQQEAAPAATDSSSGETEAAPARKQRAETAGKARTPATETPAAETDGGSAPEQSSGTMGETPPAAKSATEDNAPAASPRKKRDRAKDAAQSETATSGTAAPTETTEPRAAPARNAAPAAPDTTTPARTAEPSASEVPASPAKPGTAPAQPDAAASSGAPDATPAVPGATPERPGSARDAQTSGTSPASSDAPTAVDSTAEAPATQRPPRNLKPKAVPVDVQNAPVEADRIDRSDAQVQTLQEPVRVRPSRQERGERIEEAPRYELPPDAKVVKKVGDREILSIVGAAAVGAAAGAATGYFVKSNDDERLGVDADDRYSERLPRGRTRETIVRPNGVQVVTISNRYGDVIQRSRVMQDGREVVLFYDPYSEDGPKRDYYEDAGRDLPPVRVDIPEDRYVVDVDQPDEELYYDTLIAPPVETVERIYSVDEVRRSTRIRDKVRRIDLATINFDFGSSDVPQAQVDKLQDLAEAIQKVVKDNPGETFLIEGHTDAVGSDVSNLALSDRRAESVAGALTQYFEVPAENLVTQGYGEQELKVQTQGESRENRRVTVRRITALVKPVATSENR